jgi:hypothetical protein
MTSPTDLPELMELTTGGKQPARLLLFGAYWDQEGEDTFLVADSYSVDMDCRKGRVFNYEDQKFKSTEAMVEGFYFGSVNLRLVL